MPVWDLRPLDTIINTITHSNEGFTSMIICVGVDMGMCNLNHSHLSSPYPLLFTFKCKIIQPTNKQTKHKKVVAWRTMKLKDSLSFYVYNLYASPISRYLLINLIYRYSHEAVHADLKSTQEIQICTSCWARTPYATQTGKESFIPQPEATYC